MPEHPYHPNINPRAYADSALQKRRQHLLNMGSGLQAQPCVARTQELEAIEGELARRKADARRLSIRQSRQAA